MPLPPLLPSNTPRFRVNYTAGNNSHSFLIRSAGSPAAIGAHVNAMYLALGPLLYATIVGTTEFAVAGSDVFNPVVTGSEGTTAGAGSPVTTGLEALGINFIGRTPGGRRVRRAVFGALNSGSNFRFTLGENAAVDNAVNVLKNAGGLLLGIDGLTPIWKNYVNAKFFDHWVKEVR